LPHNPFDHPLFWTASTRIALVLGAGLLLVLLAERRNLKGLGSSSLFLRVRTWAAIALVFVLCLFAGGIAVFGLAAFVALQAIGEYVRLTGVKRRYALLHGLWTLGGLLIAALARRYFLFLPLGFFMLLTLVPVATGQVKGAHRQVSGTLLGYMYIGLPMAYFVLIKAAEDWGLEFLLIVGLSVALSDVGAFVLGSALKGPKLAPKVSPNKTWSGAAGNLIGALAGAALLSSIMPAVWTLPGRIAMVLAIAIGSVWGDLTESFVKRDFAVKDAGTLLPGFGGILDRVDSLLLTLPLANYTLLLVNNLVAVH
jgi:phosphatidate cytidylyltransferase